MCVDSRYPQTKVLFPRGRTSILKGTGIVRRRLTHAQWEALPPPDNFKGRVVVKPFF